MKQGETSYQEDIQAYIKSLKGSCYKVHGNGLTPKGEPDITGEVPYEYGWIHLKLEVKTPTGSPTPMQLYRLRRYWKTGYLAAVVVTPEDVARHIEAFTEWIGSGLLTLPRNYVCILREKGLDDPYFIYHEEGNFLPCQPILS